MQHDAGKAIVRSEQYTSCARGALGTAAAAIPTGKKLIPLGVLTNIARGQAGTQAAAHNAAVPIFVFSNVDDSIRSTIAHEIAHTIHMNECDNTTCIMYIMMLRGAYLGHGFANAYCDASKGQINAR
jgi:hypothetical protein